MCFTLLLWKGEGLKPISVCFPYIVGVHVNAKMFLIWSLLYNPITHHFSGKCASQTYFFPHCRLTKVRFWSSFIKYCHVPVTTCMAAVWLAKPSAFGWLHNSCDHHMLFNQSHTEVFTNYFQTCIGLMTMCWQYAATKKWISLKILYLLNHLLCPLNIGNEMPLF